MRCFIIIKIADYDEISEALTKVGGIGMYIVKDAATVPPGCFPIKITARSAAKMFNAGWIIKTVLIKKETQNDSSTINADARRPET